MVDHLLPRTVCLSPNQKSMHVLPHGKKTPDSSLYVQHQNLRSMERVRKKKNPHEAVRKLVVNDKPLNAVQSWYKRVFWKQNLGHAYRGWMGKYARSRQHQQ